MAFKTQLKHALQACERIRINGEAAYYSHHPWKPNERRYRLRLEKDRETDCYFDGEQVIEISDHGNAVLLDIQGTAHQLHLQQTSPLQPETVRLGGGTILD